MNRRKDKIQSPGCVPFAAFCLACALGVLTATMAVGAAEPTQGASANPLKIWEDAPAPKTIKVKQGGANGMIAKWDEWSLPIGNGRLGAVFYGNVPDELVQFNEDSLWTGGDQIFSETGGGKKDGNSNYGSYQPFGDVRLLLPHEQFTDYRRELDLNRAVGTVTYKSGGVTYRREYFASYPDRVIVIRLTAEKPGAITGGVRLTDAHLGKTTVDGNTITLRGKLDDKIYVVSGFSEIAIGTPEQIASAQRKFAGNNMKYEAQLRVIAEGGAVAAGADGELRVTGANSVTILLAAGTDYLADYAKHWQGEDPHAKVTQQLAAAAKRPYAELLARHVADYQSLFNHLQLDLGKTDARKIALPTSRRLADYRSDSNDPELLTLLTQFGRYLLISCSRSGSLPANLQGNWNPARIMAAWGADYHLNVNLQMNYWQTGPGNLSECDEPLISWLQSVTPVLTRETQEQLGARGWAAGWGVNLFGGGSVAKKAEGAWICQHLYENYRFTHDKKTLAEVSFPIIRSAVNFWEGALIETNGFLLAPDVQSPEWGPTEDGVLYAQELVWELFTEYVELADVLGVDRANRDKVAAMRDKLAAPKIGSHGEILEWQTEQPKMWDKHHRHVSHLVGLYPGRQISPLTTPALAKAAKVSVEHRGDAPEGWCKIFRAALWVRLFHGDPAMRQVESLIRTNIWPDGLDAIHSADDRDKFQIDANLGLPAVICEMLLQSQTGELNLLPALPSAFPSGSVRGIRGRDGFLVDLDWDGGVLTRAVIRSTFGGPTCKVRYGDKTTILQIKPGSSVVLDKDLKIQK